MNRFDRIIFILIMAFVFVTPLLREEAHGQLKKAPSLIYETRKDSFSLPAGIRPLSKEMKAPEEKITVSKIEIPSVDTPLKLRAILISDHVRLASIDRSIVTVGDLIHGEKVLEIRPDRVLLEKEGVRIIHFWDEGFPDLLKRIHDPPVLLFVNGDTDCLSIPGFAVVGTRSPTLYGKTVTRMLCSQMAVISTPRSSNRCTTSV